MTARGLNYTVASVADNANIGPIPLVTPCTSEIVGACLVTLKDRDVILVNADRDGLTWDSPRSGSYTAQQAFQPPVPGAPPVSFKRGWATIEGNLEGRPFHFANTHLETEDFPDSSGSPGRRVPRRTRVRPGCRYRDRRLQLRS